MVLLLLSSSPVLEAQLSVSRDVSDVVSCAAAGACVAYGDDGAAAGTDGKAFCVNLCERRGFLLRLPEHA